MSDDGQAGGDRVETEDALVTRIRVIEDQPLDARAAAYAQIFEELQQRLDDGGRSGGSQIGRG